MVTPTKDLILDFWLVPQKLPASVANKNAKKARCRPTSRDVEAKAVEEVFFLWKRKSEKSTASA